MSHPSHLTSSAKYGRHKIMENQVCYIKFHTTESDHHRYRCETKQTLFQLSHLNPTRLRVKFTKFFTINQALIKYFKFIFGTIIPPSFSFQVEKNTKNIKKRREYQHLVKNFPRLSCVQTLRENTGVKF